ncbi:hypothetical protein [Microlunatus sp. Gsoil 973]|uniref:hypothetical protein n=1 Tax=Microlunatus sp. Gsoil 973 TaxID=2672569 RepID=UPI0012B453C7|nr:hypothetical protein [Microlunatus sp. Gsoil 973]QGN32649.1 hypothetical protein GJV80_07325 [Microlunatus sp. Gsoil 973]
MAVASRRRRSKVVLGTIFAVLVAVLIAGIVGIAVTNHPTPSPSGRSGSEGSTYVNPPAAATIWLVVTLTSAVALIALGIVAAAHLRKR